jgi:hypothetical protein
VVRRRRHDDEDPFAPLEGSAVSPTPSADDDEDVFPETSPSRANVLAALAIADDETDLDQAAYYVQRAIAEALLLIVDLLPGRQGQGSAS